MSKGPQQRRWRVEEDEILREGFRIQSVAPGSKDRTINWNEIAKKILGRSNKDCRKRYYNNMAAGLKKGPWTKEEDCLLRTHIEECGLSWAMIAQKTENRSADQCSKRWHHCLDPALERQAWTEEENHRLMAAVATHGTSWKDIQLIHFSMRSANNVKNQYTILSRKYASIPQNFSPCCPRRLSNPTDVSSDNSEPRTDGELPQNHSCDVMAVDHDLPTLNTSHDSCSIPHPNSCSTDFESFLDELPSSELSDQWNMSKTNEFEAILNMPSDFVNGLSNMSCFNTSPSATDAHYVLPRENFDQHAQYRNTNTISYIDSLGCGSTPSQTSSLNFQQNSMASDLDTTASQTLAQAYVVRQDDEPNSSRLVITIDDAEPATVMGVMKVLVDSKAKVNFQSA